LFNECIAQKESNVWYFGGNAGLDFNGPVPVTLIDGALSTYEGCASIADRVTGSILLYTDGVTVWDRNHNPMPGCISTPLNGHPSSSQSGVIVPKPGSPNIYYIFTTPAQAGAKTDFQSTAMCYSIVDLNLNGGNGDVIAINTEIMAPSTEKIAVVGNCMKSAYWIVGHKWNCDSFYAFRLTASGLSEPIKSKTGIVHEASGSSETNGEAIGYMKFSPNGRKLGVVTFAASNTVQIFNFNFNTGVVSNPITDVMDNEQEPRSGPYGCSFSPDNRRFYVSYLGDNYSTIYQYNMELATPAAILASRMVVGSGYGALQNAPDGKMYIASSGNPLLAAINNPNALGLACDYVAEAISLGSATSNMGLPCIVESFLSEPGTPLFNTPKKNVVCDGDTVFAPQFLTDSFSITPNAGFSISQDGAMVAFFPETTTVYTVITKGVCGGQDDTLSFTIYTSKGPKADFVFDPENPVLRDRAINLLNKSLRANDYTWYNGNQELESLDKDHNILIAHEGEMCYTLVAADTFKCTDTAQKCVVVKSGIDESVVEIPNSFSPNGDGLNDEFKLRGYNIRLNSFSIFNRYGQRVFFTTDKSVGWDGKFNGVPCDIGTYFYMVKYEDQHNNKELLKGSVLLIR
jgi:gliding motility-associated-like protein